MIRLLLVLLLLAGPALAVTSPDEMLGDPGLEARARSLSQGLRCLVCQNESIDDSNADLARDLRRLVRERLVAGDSDAAVRGYLVARYGDFVLLEPPVRAATYLLWFGPFALLLAGAGLVVAYYRGGTAPPAQAELTAEERSTLDEVMREPVGKTGR